MSKPKFRWYAGLTLSSTNLKLIQNTQQSVEKLVWRVGGTRIYTGISWFISVGPIAINFNLGRDARRFDLKEYSITNKTQDLTNISGKLDVTGIDVHIGLVVRIKR